LDDREGAMHLRRLVASVASLGLLATPASRLAVVVTGAAATAGCEPCTVGPISPDSLPDGQVRVVYYLLLHAQTHGSGCSGPVEFSRVDGSLPPGIELSKEGLLYGPPSLSGAYRFTLMATFDIGEDYVSPESVPQTYTLLISP
jgi:hypothetical protein